MPKEIDLKGKIFGRWTVLEKIFLIPDRALDGYANVHVTSIQLDRSKGRH